MRRYAVLTLIAALSPLAFGQRSASFGGHAASPARTGPARAVHGANSVLGHGYRGRSSRFDRRGAAYTSLPFPFFADAFDSDDVYSTGYPVSSALPPYLMPLMRTMSGVLPDSLESRTSSPEAQSSEPLMIELQNGRYVHVTGPAIDGEALPLPAFPQDARQGVSGRPAPPAPALTPALLIFRDGHSEQVRDYTIADGALYARGDFYVDGYWNRKINLANLDVPQTLEANAQRGVKFVLPSSPNEVVTRP